MAILKETILKKGLLKKIIKSKKPANQNRRTDPKNVAASEKMRDDFIRKMQKPHVKDSELQKIVDRLYKPNARIGSGSTADALRSELKTGKPVGGKFHTQKSGEHLRRLKSWINKHTENSNRPLSETARRVSAPKPSAQDMRTAENLIRDLENALKGK